MPLEIACFNLQSAVLASKFADRVELCGGPQSSGGVTPPLYDIQSLAEDSKCPVNIMIRPRAGNFTYNSLEYEMMKEQIEIIKQIQPSVNGFVFGILDAEHKVDQVRCSELVRLASPLPCTFHRAIDETPDMFEALKAIEQCGFRAVLSSGGQPTAMKGADMLRRIVTLHGSSVNIIVGGSVRRDNLGELCEQTKASWYHSSAIIARLEESADQEEILAMQEVLMAMTLAVE